MQILTIEALLLIFLIAITLTIIFTKDLLASIIVYSGFSFCAMLLYIIMGAADVAFTEAVIGVVSTIYFVIAIKALGRIKDKPKTEPAELEAAVDQMAGAEPGKSEATADQNAKEDSND